MFKEGKIGILGGVYNIENGKVDFFKTLTSEKKQDKRSINAHNNNVFIND